MTDWRTLLTRYLGFAGLLVVLGAALTSVNLPEIPEIDLTPTARPLAALSATQYRVSAVVDGDTLKVTKDGETSTVRLIGVDTPESVDPRKPVECFATEATAFAQQLLLDQPVDLITDSTQEDVDRYGRILRYVLLADGSLANERLIREGYAFEYTYRTAYQRQREFRVAQAEARAEGRGLWSPNTCAGER